METALKSVFYGLLFFSARPFTPATRVRVPLGSPPYLPRINVLKSPVCRDASIRAIGVRVPGVYRSMTSSFRNEVMEEKRCSQIGRLLQQPAKGATFVSFLAFHQHVDLRLTAIVE